MEEKTKKERLFEIIEVAKPHDTTSRIFDIVIIALIIINIVVVIAETFPAAAADFKYVFFTIEIITVFIFSIEYICRFWTADMLYPHLSKARARSKYLFSFMALIDLLAILPLYLILLVPGAPAGAAALRVLRAVRLIRIFKMGRYTRSMHVIGAVIRKKASLLISSLLVVGALIIIASILMFYAENAAQPEAFDNVFDAMWWSIITMTAVGYGDIYPITFIGRALASIIALLGVTLFALPTGIITAGFIEHVNGQKKAKELPMLEDVLPKNKEYCPYCGEKLD